MYKTLAFRNMKRQLRNYSIYFVTVAMTISLIFAMNNMIYNKDIQERADELALLSVGLLILSVFLCFVIAIVLTYANAFILRLRQREFGTYLTLGMKRHQIAKLFLIENSFLGVFAMLVGFLFGSLLYQGLMLLMSNLLHYPFSFSFISIKGVIVTLIMVVLMFTVTFISSSIYLKRVTIYNLIHGEQSVQKANRKPLLSSIIALLSLAAMVYALIQFSSHVEGVFAATSGSEMYLLLMLVLLAVSIITLHVSLAKSLMYVLLKNKHLRQKGTNAFVLRQLSASLNANALLLGLLAFLISFAIIATNTGFLYKAVEEENIAKRYPFDIMGNDSIDQPSPISKNQAVQAIEKETTIKRSFETPVFTSGKSDFLKQTVWYDEELTDRDVYVRESDFNQLLHALGEKQISLKNEYAIYSDSPLIQNAHFQKQTIKANGKNYTFQQANSTLPLFIWAYFIIVVPDDVIVEMKQVQTAYAWDVENTTFDATKLNAALSYEEKNGDYAIQRSDYRIQQYELMHSMTFSAILIVGALYIGLVFILLAMAILTLKTLSAIHADEKRYAILQHIGVSKTVRTTTLAKQIFAFFAFPVAIPLVLVIPITRISEQFIHLLGFAEQLNGSILSMTIVATTLIIYFIYFFITFTITKKYVISS